MLDYDNPDRFRDALDNRGILKDGKAVRVPTFLRDGINPSLTSQVASSRPHLTDANGSSDKFAFSRPGFRIMHDVAAHDACEAAYQQYQDELVNAWKTPNGLGIGNLGRRS